MATHSYPADFDAAHWTARTGQWSADEILKKALPPRYLQIQGEEGYQPQPALALPSSVDFIKPLNIPKTDHSGYLLPTSEEQCALTVLKDYPDHLLARWFDLARSQPAGMYSVKDLLGAMC